MAEPEQASTEDPDPRPMVDAVVASLDHPEPVVRGLAEAILRRLPVEQRDAPALTEHVAHAVAVLSRRAPGELGIRRTDSEDGTAFDVNVDDAPLLLSTALEEIESHGIGTRTVLHPVLGVRRDDDGRLEAVEPARRASHREAWLHLLLDRRLDEEEAARLEEGLREALATARQVHTDLPTMQERVAAAGEALRQQPGEEAAEAAALVDWLLADRLVLLGTAVGGERLGVLREEIPAVIPGQDGALVRVGRGLVVSRVHRHERMVDVRLRVPQRTVRVVGLFAAQAYADAVVAIPLARRSLERILDVEDLVEGSHDERALRGLFASLPLDVQLGADPAELRRTLVPLLAAQREQEVALRCRIDQEARVANVIVTLPRARFSQRVRERIQATLLERFAGVDVDYHLSITREDWVLLHFVVHAPEGGALDTPRLDDLQRRVVSLTRTWSDAVEAALRERCGPVKARRLVGGWMGWLPAGYAEQTSPEAAVDDLVTLDEMSRSDEAMHMRLALEREGAWRARLYLRGGGTDLSRLVPVLESLGLVVVDEVPFEVADWGHIHDVRLRVPAGFDTDPAQGDKGADAALAVLAGRAEADDLNRLVLLAGLAWQDVGVLRAYRRYRRQVGTQFTEEYQNAALFDHPAVARALVELFAAKHDPRLEGEAGAVAAARATLDAALEEVTRLDRDRILRGYAGLVEATLRTNRYIEPHRPWVTLKFDSDRVPDVGKPTPHVDTFVYAPDLEGIHLRGGPVARGGIRHSDRQEDVRAEVLGLMKAQMAKNALIVPVGAKGGFVLKGAPSDPAAVRDGYERFVRALLDVTDNIVDGEVRRPRGVRASDGDDAYLVVAPDRGTGTFSDLANEIAHERGFWLSDAFAAGGSRGYDHKAMGITARGAWVAVRRHFAELGVDVTADPVTVIGIGDMSGDVFGNALRQSRSLRLVAAFDHRDLFLDPQPDPERSFAERERLAALPGSTWQDYDRDVISPGGGVWPRTVKAIPLSEEVREILRVDADRMSPPELIRTILRAPADLLFAGGVGTFVKSSAETDADVSDRANDGVRIDATDLSVRVVGEGANLALTQRARVQYSRRGGRCNTDAVDNAAGVATSDAEVNLKILLADAEAQGRLEPLERDRHLAAAAEEVAARVLADVDAQVRAISHELQASPGGLDAYEELMADLEAGGRLDREVEALPDSAEMERRRKAGAGLTRPEVAVLLAYAKIDLRDAVLGSDLVDDPGVRPLLLGYLPTGIRERFGDLIDGHRLRRELVATRLANAVVDDMGVTWARRAAEEVGVDVVGAAGAYWVAREVTGAKGLWAEIAGLGSEVERTVIAELDEAVRAIVDGCARVYARLRPARATAEEAIARDTAPAQQMARLLVGREHAWRRATVTRWAGGGVPEELAARVASLPSLAAVPDVAEVARAHDRVVSDIVEAFQMAGDRLPLARLETVIDRMVPEERWSRWHREGLVDELRRVRRDAVARALATSLEAPGPQAVAAWLDDRAPGLLQVDQLVATLEREEPGLDGAAVAVRTLRDAVEA